MGGALYTGYSQMPDYTELLNYLAENPPQMESERQLHASLLELMAQCLRHEQIPAETNVQDDDGSLDERIQESHIHWVRFN